MPAGSKFVALLSASFPFRSFTALRLARFSSQQFYDFSSVAVFRGRHGFALPRPYLGFCRHAYNQFCTKASVNDEGRFDVATLFPDSKNSHPWPEWSSLANLLVVKGCADKCITSGDDDDSFFVDEDLPEEFLNAVKACLGFARDRPDILRLLSKKNIEAVVLNGAPLLFKYGENSAARLNYFITGDKNNELELENAQTIDIMRYLLSYVYGSISSSDDSNLKAKDFLERSVRKLLCELFNLSGTIWKPISVDAVSVELPLSKGQLSGHFRQSIETKSGDQNFPKIPDRSSAAPDMDYGNHVAFPKQSLETTQSLQNRDWNSSHVGFTAHSAQPFTAHSAQPSTGNLEKNVEYFNRAKTLSAYNGQTLNEATSIHASTNSSKPLHHLENSYNANDCGNNGKPAYSSNSWANSATTYDELSNLSSPLKSLWNDGHNVISTQPFDSSSGNSRACYSVPADTSRASQSSSSSWDNHSNSFQPPNNAWCNNNPSQARNSSQPPNASHDGSNESHQWQNRNQSYFAYTTSYSPPPHGLYNYNTSINGSAMKSTQWNKDPNSWENSAEQSMISKSNDYRGGNADSYQRYSSNSTLPPNHSWSNSRTNAGTSLNPAGNNSTERSNDIVYQGNNPTVNKTYDYSSKSLEGSCVKEPDPLDMSEEAKAERWFRRAAQIKDISELSQIPDEDFPQIMPMRKGVNRFVVSKRKTPLERRLASQQYKRNLPVVSSESEKDPLSGDKEV